MAIFSLLIAFISIPFSAYGALPTTIIKSCYDGDTCTTINGEKLRLACIDTPELKGKKAEPIAAREARDFLNNLVIFLIKYKTRSVQFCSSPTLA